MYKFLTLFGINNRKVAIALATLFGLAVSVLLGVETLFMFMLLFAIITIFEGNKACQKAQLECKDINSDTLVGTFIALNTSLASIQTPSNTLILIATILAFVSYVGMDIYKPSTIKWLRENVKGALGITLSSLLAGIAGGMLSILVLTLIQKYI